MNTGQSYIAGWKTADDWRSFRAELVASKDASRWDKAFEEYFRARIDLRYFGPIKTLQEHGTFQGEGFSILAVQCSLVEFLESTVQGIKYRFRRSGETLGPYEYSSSRDVYVSFLCKRTPFAREFNEALANDFYADIRCGLLHEARTKNGWRVWAKSSAGSIINPVERIVYRDNLQLALESFVDWYRQAPRADHLVQEVFVRKFDDLCE
jgi:hypothetical protein